MYARVRKALPELYAFTACMWLRSRSGGTGQGTPFSYSVPGQANEIVLLEAGHDPMELLINDKVSGGGQSGRDGGQGSPFQKHCTMLSPTHGPFQFCWAYSVRMPCLLCARLSSGNTKTSQTWGWLERGSGPSRTVSVVFPFTGEACETHRESDFPSDPTLGARLEVSAPGVGGMRGAAHFPG